VLFYLELALFFVACEAAIWGLAFVLVWLMETLTGFRRNLKSIS
jgi:hypothetical protein